MPETEPDVASSTLKFVQVNQCQIHCIFWEGRLRHTAVFTVYNLLTNVSTDVTCDMGLWHLVEPEQVISELGIVADTPLKVVRYAHGAMFLQSYDGTIHYNVKMRGA